ncbi:putative aldouronate transport system permease protein [Lachnotalea glycerini]|uniref:Putative aldouronate transport system permease protein n=1 Tax=Lachnotalea glycerini TaxID=1763509 RepID=A0A318EQX7_9FIRM|nr:carbohydrate ABC transporter permease [Lachnotalea glycerini]PXV91786.1 putative aldouronate transport system permease protein [Lachnotalea glycerini]
MEINSRSSRIFQLVSGVIFVLICALTLIPVLRVIAISFSSKSAILAGQVFVFPVGFTMEAYHKVFGNINFLRSFVYTIVLTLGFTAISMMMTILAAYPLSKKGLKGGSIIMTLFVLTMYFDPGTIPTYLNVKSFGLINTAWSLIIPGSLSAYNLIIMRSFFTSIDKSLYESAYIDGCSEWKALYKIAVPLSVPAIATLSLFYAVWRWNNVSDVLYYINKSNLYTVQMMLKQMIDSVKISLLEGKTSQLAADNIKAASIVISMTPMLIAYPFIQKYFTKGIMLGAVKG